MNRRKFFAMLMGGAASVAAALGMPRDADMPYLYGNLAPGEAFAPTAGKDNDILLRHGVLTRDEVRQRLGMDFDEITCLDAPVATTFVKFSI
jgi:hypothetical protein